ncbi:hypothetical protein [Sphingomonas sp.]|uniref:hypothetical protein n=1 Tax=Sphingomonas sp. TaxID=28214 RepID=UPI002E0E1E69|nr:hypothetical protein [Sphingomonas sp.]
MTDTLALEVPPQVLRSHQVHTLPSLQMAIDDLLRAARDAGNSGPINLADFDPKDGLTVALTRDDRGMMAITFRRGKRQGKVA